MADYVDGVVARHLEDDYARRLLEVFDEFLGEVDRRMATGEAAHPACSAAREVALAAFADRAREFELALSLASEQTERRYLDGAPSQ